MYYSEVDDAIMAAYNHVKKTGHKMSRYYNNDENLKQVELGFICDDGNIFAMTIHDHNNSQKRSLARKIKEYKVSVIEVVNKQLLAFL